MWEVKMIAFGATETTSVHGATVGEAMAAALEEFGVEENDEGVLTFEISGEAGA